jgi:hypothetical protein
MGRNVVLMLVLSAFFAASIGRFAGSLLNVHALLAPNCILLQQHHRRNC